MTWKVIEYMDMNPQATAKDIALHFATELEVDRHIESVNLEMDKVLEIRDELRPLYAKKYNLDIELARIDSDLDMDILIKYPPRKGSEKERKAYKKELQSQHKEYLPLFEESESLKEKISHLETEMSDFQNRAKNGRRILETFSSYMQFILATKQANLSMKIENVESETAASKPVANANLF